MTRRLPAVVLALAAVVAIVVGARERTDAVVPAFSESILGWMPSAPPTGVLTEPWFCPGVPATGVDGVEGDVVVANRTGDPLVGTALLMNDRRESRRVDLGVPAWGTTVVDLDATLPGDIVGALVEVDGGGAIVEQRSVHPAGNSVAACANATSDRWYLADGFTVDGSLDQVILTNPYEQTVVANLEFSTREGPRSPTSYRGLTVPPQSVRVIDLGAPGAGAQNEPILAVSVSTTRGRLVVGRFQHYLGGGRLGAQATLASPALRDQWWFAGGEGGAGITEQYAIYNPTEDDLQVDTIVVGGSSQVLPPDPLDVPSGQVVLFDPATLDPPPQGRYTIVFSTEADQSIAVERATTRTVDDTVATSVVAGATVRPRDGFVATTWLLARAPAEPTTSALEVYNADLADATVTVYAVGPTGPVAVPSLTDVPLPSLTLLVIDLTDPGVVGRQVIVQSTSRVFVERSDPTGRGTTRASAWAVPQT